MDSTSLSAIVDEQLALAREAPSSRSARTIHGGQARVLRETVIALLGGHERAVHESPGVATLHVLRGRVRLVSGDETCDADVGDHLIVPGDRHSLVAVEDSVVLLTVAKPLP